MTTTSNTFESKKETDDVLEKGNAPTTTTTTTTTTTPTIDGNGDFHMNDEIDAEAEDSFEDESSSEEDVDDSIRCPCGKRKDAGLMIQCEKCDLWQHSRCMGIHSKKGIPDPYYCLRCRPGPLDSPEPPSSSSSSRKRPSSGSVKIEERATKIRKKEKTSLSPESPEQDLPSSASKKRPLAGEVAVLETTLTDFPFPSAPVSREERKIQQAMKAFERMERKDGKGYRRTDALGDQSPSPSLSSLQHTPLKRVSTPKTRARPVVLFFFIFFLILNQSKEKKIERKRESKKVCLSKKTHKMCGRHGAPDAKQK